MRKLADLGQQRAGIVVFGDHVGDGTFHTAEECGGNCPSALHGFFHAYDVRKEHLLFLDHVGGKLLSDGREKLLDLDQFRMRSGVFTNHFGE